MKERPILFKDEMIRAILEGRKTQTRRVVKPQPETMRDHFPTTPETMMSDGYSSNGVFKITEKPGVYRCLGMRNFVEAFSPYGQPGDRLWVREAFRLCVEADATKPRDTDAAYRVWYEADAPHQPGFGRLRPSMHMPRWASRITLEITSVRVERLNDISEADAKAEGADSCIFKGFSTAADLLIDWPLMEEMHPYRNGFALLWESINGPDSWDANPWVWVVEFKRVQS